MSEPIAEDLDIRAASESDAAAIAGIYNHYVRAGGATFDTSDWDPARVVSLVRSDPPDGWYVAIQQQKVIGWASIRRYSPRHGYRFTCETAIYLDPKAIGKQVGNRLQQRVDHHCRQHQIHHAVAKIIADNDRSLAFHRRFGYELVGIQKQIGRMDGKWVDVAILQKIYDTTADRL